MIQGAGKTRHDRHMHLTQLVRQDVWKAFQSSFVASIVDRQLESSWEINSAPTSAAHGILQAGGKGHSVDFVLCHSIG